MFNTIITSFRKRFPAIHYGYVIVTTCFLIMTIAYGAQTTFGVFFKPMSKEFEWSRAATSGPVALYMVTSGLLTIVSGRLSDRFGAWKIVAGGAIVSGIGYLLMYDIHSLWQLFVYYGVLVATGSAAMYVPMVSMIARWFTKRRGLMSGIGIAGIGFGIGIVPPIANALLQALGWRPPLLIIGGSVIILIGLLSLLLRHDVKPNEDSTSLNIEKVGKKTLGDGLTFKEARSRSQFWLIITAWVGYGFIFQSAVVHIVPYATDLGMTASKAAGILAIIGIIGTVGRIALGFVGDKLGNRRTIVVSYVLMGLAFAGLALVVRVSMLYIFAVVFGALFGIGVLAIPFITEYFGFKQLGIISGTIICANSLGGAMGPPAAGGIFDATQSYHLAFMLCSIVSLAAGLMVYLARPLK